MKEFRVGIKMGKEERGLIRKCSCFLLQLMITKHAFLCCFFFQMRSKEDESLYDFI